MITHEEFIKKHNLKESYYYQENGWLYIVLDFNRLYYNYHINFSIEELPSKINFTEKCNHDITIRKIKKMPPDVIFNNNGDVHIYYVEEISENVVFNNNGNVNLGEFENYNIEKLKKIHPSVRFTNSKDVFLGNIIDKIPKEISFNNKKNIFTYNIKEISEKVTFENDGTLYLRGKLEKVHPSVKFINGGDIFTQEFPKEITFSNKGDVYVGIEEYIPENVIFNNGGDVRFYDYNSKIIFSKGVRFNNKGEIKNLSILKIIPEFLDSKKYLNKIIKQLSK